MTLTVRTSGSTAQDVGLVSGDLAGNADRQARARKRVPADQALLFRDRGAPHRLHPKSFMKLRLRPWRFLMSAT